MYAVCHSLNKVSEFYDTIVGSENTDYIRSSQSRRWFMGIFPLSLLQAKEK